MGVNVSTTQGRELDEEVAGGRTLEEPISTSARFYTREGTTTPP